MRRRRIAADADDGRVAAAAHRIVGLVHRHVVGAGHNQSERRSISSVSLTINDHHPFLGFLMALVELDQIRVG